MLTLKPYHEIGGGDLGWLKAKHQFAIGGIATHGIQAMHFPGVEFREFADQSQIVPSSVVWRSDNRNRALKRLVDLARSYLQKAHVPKLRSAI